MRTIHVFQAGHNYFIDGIYWGDDEEDVMMYLRAKGISPTISPRHWQESRRQGLYHPARGIGVDLRARVR
jgi:hypothetical protein